MSSLLPVWLLSVALLIALVERLRAPRPVSAERVPQRPDSAVFTPLPQSLAMESTGEDVVGFLERQHAEIKALFAETLAATGSARQGSFLALRRLIAIHEATEEELFHPEAKRALGANGHAIIAARIEEERAAATVITEIESLAVDSMQFEMALRKLQHDVDQHATHEEQREFPALAGVDATGLRHVRDVGRALYAPAGALTGALTRDIGPFVAMLNQARDLLGGKRSLPVPSATMRAAAAPRAAE